MLRRGKTGDRYELKEHKKQAELFIPVKNVNRTIGLSQRLQKSIESTKLRESLVHQRQNENEFNCTISTMSI